MNSICVGDCMGLAVCIFLKQLREIVKIKGPFDDRSNGLGIDLILKYYMHKVECLRPLSLFDMDKGAETQRALEVLREQLVDEWKRTIV